MGDLGYFSRWQVYPLGFLFILTNDTVLRDEILDELLCVCNGCGSSAHTQSFRHGSESIRQIRWSFVKTSDILVSIFFLNLILILWQRKNGFLCAHPVFPSDGVVRRGYCKIKGKQKKKKKKEKFEYVGVFIRNPPFFFFTLPH